MGVRLDDVDRVSAAEVLHPTDGLGQLKRLTGQIGKSRGELVSLRAAGGIGQNRLVDGGGNIGDGVHGDSFAGSVITGSGGGRRMCR